MFDTVSVAPDYLQAQSRNLPKIAFVNSHQLRRTPRHASLRSWQPRRTTGPSPLTTAQNSSFRSVTDRVDGPAPRHWRPRRTSRSVTAQTAGPSPLFYAAARQFWRFLKMMVLNCFALSGATDTVSNMASKTLMANFGLNDVTICSLLQVMVTSKNFQNFFFYFK